MATGEEVARWFVAHPDGTAAGCATALGVGGVDPARKVRKLRAEARLQAIEAGQAAAATAGGEALEPEEIVLGLGPGLQVPARPWVAPVAADVPDLPTLEDGSPVARYAVGRDVHPRPDFWTAVGYVAAGLGLALCFVVGRAWYLLRGSEEEQNALGSRGRMVANVVIGVCFVLLLMLWLRG